MPLARHDKVKGHCELETCNFYSHASCEAWQLISAQTQQNIKFLLTCLLRGMTTFWSNESIMNSYFYSHASCEAWRLLRRQRARHRKFLLTCLLRGMTIIGMVVRMADWISTHMPLARHDKILLKTCWHYSKFLLTCLLRGMTKILTYQEAADWDFYSHASCEAWPNPSRNKNGGECISTHMPLARHDMLSFPLNIYWLISTHMPLARHDMARREIYADEFISTHMPLARHDHWSNYNTYFCRNFYSHASCEAWPFTPIFYSPAFTISTHMPLARHDVFRAVRVCA